MKLECVEGCSRITIPDWTLMVELQQKSRNLCVVCGGELYEVSPEDAGEGIIQED